MKMLITAVNRFALLLTICISIPAASAFYDPTVQRWVNRDPTSEAGGINLHQSVENNPMSAVDPFGFDNMYDPGAGQNAPVNVIFFQKVTGGPVETRAGGTDYLMLGTLEFVAVTLVTTPPRSPIKPPPLPACPATKGSVKPGDTGTYGDLKAQKLTKGETEALHMDHQPSFAAQVRAQETALGRPLTKAELSQLKASTPAVASPAQVHQQTSPTYGGRNTGARIAEDAADLESAAARDRAIFNEAMRNR